MKKRIISLLLIVVLCLTLLPAAALAAEPERSGNANEATIAEVTVNDKTTGYPSLDAAIEAVNGSSETDMVTLTLLQDADISKTLSISKNVTIRSDKNAPRTITSSTDQHGYLLRLTADVTLENIVIDGGSADSVTASRALIAVGDGTSSGSLVLRDGVVLQNNNNTTERGAGGAVCVLKGSHLTISGGKITGNTAYQGGGIAVMDASCEVQILDGVIANNHATTTKQTGGGGVYLYAGTVTMTGGNITGNDAARYGGGIYIYGAANKQAASFLLQGGSIAQNQAQYGGGMFVSMASLVKLSGGSVTGNIATKWAGGVMIAPECNITLSGSIRIVDNTNNSNEPGKDLYLDGYQVSDEVYFPSVTLEELNNHATLNIYTYLKSIEGGVLEIATPPENGSISAETRERLCYEDADYLLHVSEEGRLILTAKETAPEPKRGALTVANDQAYVYRFDFRTLLPALDEGKSYGVITYGTPNISLGDYYTEGAAIDANGVLTLPIVKNNVTTEDEIGTVTVSVSSTNYRAFTLTLHVSASNKKISTGEPTLSQNELTYGEAIEKITLSGSMKYDGIEVPGTFAWTAPETKPDAGSCEAAWVFTPKDPLHYCTTHGSAIITVHKAKPSGTPKYTAITSSGKTLFGAGLTTEGSTFSVEGTVKWVDANGNELSNHTEVQANTSYRWMFIPADNNYETLTGSILLWRRSSDGSGTPIYNVISSQTENGSVNTSHKSAGKGTTVTITVTPDKGFTLETLTVTDKDGKEVTLTKKSDTQYTFTMPASKVEVKASFQDDNTMLNYFVDVKSGDYFYDAVLWAVQKGITNGTDAVHFSPEDACTRAQIVTFLWRAAGSPVVNYAMDMTDVPEDAYYAEAVRWALSEGITIGTTTTTFSPDETCTRAQAVTFLHRYRNAPDADGAASFPDVAAGSWYEAAVRWAVANNITTGTSETTFSPDDDCTRAQIVTFLYRMLAK